jgi:hypothetical protein
MTSCFCIVGNRQCSLLGALILFLSVIPAVSFAFTSSSPSNLLLNMLSNDDDTSNDSRANKSNVRILGVCGGIGSGKSKACELLVSELGCISHIGRLVAMSRLLQLSRLLRLTLTLSTCHSTIFRGRFNCPQSVPTRKPSYFRCSRAVWTRYSSDRQTYKRSRD